MKDSLILFLLILAALIVLQRGCGGFGERFQENRQQRQEQRKENQQERQENRQERQQQRRERKRFMDGRKRFKDRERNNTNTYGNGIGVEEAVRP